VDGFDSTDVIIETLRGYRKHFRIILTHGITTGGMNLIDLERIYNSLKVAIIAVTENKPSDMALERAICNLPRSDARLQILARAGPIYSVRTPAGKNEVFFHVKGITERLAGLYLKEFAIRSRLPECLHLAHKIASGIKTRDG